MINANDKGYDELDDELDLAATDSLPWLESDGADEDPAGFDIVQLVAFGAMLVAIFGGVLGAVWFFSSRPASPEVVADGSVIPAPPGPIKVRPTDPGGKEFEGTGNVAPVVGEGGELPAVVAKSDSAEPPVPDTAASPAPTPAATASPAAPAARGVGVQLAAYGTRERAEKGWSEISRRTEVLSGVSHRVVEGKVDIGTVYRLQAVASSRAEAERLCAALKADGLDCQIKP